MIIVLGISVVMVAESADIAAISAIGLALLHRYSLSSKLCEEPLPVPEEMIHEAALFHPFAEAAYTLICQLLPVYYSRPLLEGDNWWRGHPAAFLKYVKLTDDVLRKGRVNQDKFKATYFIVVLPHLKTVVIAVHGTETPEDLITDGLCRECNLSEGDLDGLVKSEKRGVHARWCSKVCLLALPVRAGNMGVVLHSVLDNGKGAEV
nr:sn1-specific diacylglycerol lipase beta isoform X3 [Ipomoea batatas]